MLGASVVGSIAFYLITNTATGSWNRATPRPLRVGCSADHRLARLPSTLVLFPQHRRSDLLFTSAVCRVHDVAAAKQARAMRSCTISLPVIWRLAVSPTHH
jgi:hypothetical protein